MSSFFVCQHLCAETTNALPSQVNGSKKPHIFPVKFPDERGEKEKWKLREKIGEHPVTMTGPLTGLVVSVSGLSCGQRATVVLEEHC